MSGPTLNLGISALGADQVKQLAESVGMLDRNLASLQARQGSGAGALSGLEVLAAQMRQAQQSLGQSTAALRTDLTEMKQEITKGFALMAEAMSKGGRQAATEAEQAAEKVERAAARIRVAGQKIDLGKGLSASVGGSGLKSLPQVETLTSELEKLPRAVEASMGATAAEFVKQGDKMKAQWLQHLKELKVRLDAEKTMMEDAVRQFRAVMETQLAAQMEAEEKQKSAFFKYDAERRARMKMELTAMDDAVRQYRAIQEEKLLAQIQADEKQKGQWIKYMAEVDARLKAEQFMMGDAVRQYRELRDKEVAEQIIHDERQKAQWIKYNADLQAQIAKEVAAMQKRAADIDLAERTADAAYNRASDRAKIRITMSARSQLDAGVPADVISQRTGPAALSAAGATSLGALRAQYDALGNSAAAAAPKIRASADQMEYAHSAARGLTSGFGALWLTWGSMVPLIAGAAISHSFVQIVKQGAEVQNTFTQIRVLAGESAESVDMLSGKMMELARSSQYGPAELAKAMKTLSLAGLDSKEVFTAIKDVLNFATAGDTSIEKAADVMTTVGTAFNLSANMYTYVGDTIAKAAAESKSSVESMGEAFKTASVIHQQYGVTLEDTAVGLALVANAGIQGTAAGTALRNMYVDLAGRAPKVTKALQELGVEALDPVTGKMRNQAVVFEELIKALSTKTPTAQFKYIQDIFSERGGKEAIAIMTAMQKQAEDMGVSVATAYDQLADKVMNAAGFTVRAAAEMSLTPLNQLKSVKSAMEATFVETFDALAPQIIEFSTRLKELFNDPEFKKGLQAMAVLIGEVTVGFVENIRVIAAAVATYAAFKTAAGVLGTVAAATTAWGAATSAAVTEVGLATRMAGLANPILAVLTGVVMAGTAAWAAYQLWTGKATEAVEQAGGSSGVTALLERLTEEEKRIDKVNEARLRGISLTQLEAELKVEEARSTEPYALVNARKKLQEFDEQTPRNAGGKNRAKLPFESQEDYDKQFGAAGQANERAKLVAKVNEEESKYLAELVKLENTQDRINEKLRKQADDQRNIDRIKAATTPRGDGERPEKVKAIRDTGMADVTSALNDQLGAIRNSYSTREKVIEDAYRAEQISAGAYFAQINALARETQKSEEDAIAATTKKFDKEYAERVAVITAAYKGRPQELEQQLANLAGQYDKYTAHVGAAWEKIVNDTNSKQAELALNYERDTNRIVKANDQYWLKAEQTANKDLAQSKAKRELANASEEVRAVAEAQAKVEASHSQQIENLTTELNKAKKAVDDFYSAYDNRDLDAAAGADAQALVDKVDRLTAALKKAQDEVTKLKGIMSEDAVNDLQNKRDQKRREDAKKMADEVSGKLADAILDGGKDGFKSLTSWMQDYLLKRPLKMIIQAILQPVGNMVANVALNSMGLGSIGGGGGAMGGGGGGASLFGNIGSGASGMSAVMGGGSVMTGMGGFTTGASMTMGNGMVGGFGANMANIGAMAEGGNFAMAAGAAMPYVAAAIAIYMIAKKIFSGGETRSGGQYSGTNLLAAPSGGEINGADTRKAISATQDSINATIKSLGGTVQLQGFVSGLESSQNGKGFAYAGGRLSNNVTFGQGNDGQGYMNRRGNMTPEEAAKAFAEELQQATLQALQASDIKGKLADYIRGLGNIDALTGDALTKAYDKVMKAMAERGTLQDRLDKLTMNSVQALAKAREKERAAIDDTNQDILEQIYAHEDLVTASQNLVAAYNEQTATMGTSITSLKSYAKSLRTWVSGALTGDNSPLSGSEQLAALSAQFDNTLAAARGGDTDAQSALTGDADKLLAALKASAPDFATYALGFGKVTSALTIEAARADSQATIQQQQLDTAKSQLEQLGLINTSVTSFEEAYKAYQEAKAKADGIDAGMVAAAAAAPSVVVADTSSNAAPTKAWNWVDYVNGSYNEPTSGYATGGYHRGGLRIVGENGPEIEATGASYIYDAAATRRMLSGDGGSDDDAVVQEIRMLRTALESNVQFTYLLQKDIHELRVRGVQVRTPDDGSKLSTTTS